MTQPISLRVPVANGNFYALNHLLEVTLLCSACFLTRLLIHWLVDSQQILSRWPGSMKHSFHNVPQHLKNIKSTASGQRLNYHKDSDILYKNLKVPKKILKSIFLDI